MRQFIIRRLIISVFILFGVSILLYTIIRLMPGDYVQNATASNKNVTEEMRMHLRSIYGLDKGIIEGYLDWAGNAIKGDLGTSFQFKRPVTEIISSKMWISFSLAFSAFILELLIGIPLGIIAATKQYSKVDYLITTFAFMGISLPTFFFAAVFQRIFAMEFHILPLQGMITARANYTGIELIFDIALHFIMPVSIFVIAEVGNWMRFVRAGMLEVLNQDYIRTARAKGLSESSVVYKHAYSNTLIPIITRIGIRIPLLFGGAIITEGIFSIDGLGRTALMAINQGDIPFMMGFNMFLAILILMGTLIADILYAVVDPRVRLS